MSSNTSPWLSGTPRATFPALSGDISTGTVVIGGGITGVTAAVRLKAAGRRVVLLEQAHIGAGETGHTTAHLTEQLDRPYRDLVGNLGRDAARLAAEGTRSAIDLIESLCREHSVQSAFERVSGFLYTESKEDVVRLKTELDAILSVGVAASWVDDIPLPFTTSGGIRFERQARLQPLQYLQALAHHIPGGGCHVFERTRATGLTSSDRPVVETPEGTVTATDVVVATDAPFDRTLLGDVRPFPIRSFAIAAPNPNGSVPANLFWDTATPYHYLRTWKSEDDDLLIVGGEDRPFDGADPSEAFERLARYARDHFGVVTVAYRWSGRVFETRDGLPLIGASAEHPHVYLATGFSGNGLTFGTLAATILADMILGRPNQFQHLYDPRRESVMSKTRGIGSSPETPAVDSDVPRDQALDAISPGTGAVVTINGGRYAIYREVAGTLRVLSPECPHVYCEVLWNQQAACWDCPCHGSRFAADGRLLRGPATESLAAARLP